MVTRPSDSADLAETQIDSKGVSAILARADVDAIRPGARIGRYMVVEIVGSGGIGIVYAAYDPDLDRKVALKLLRQSKLSGSSDAVVQRRARLRREALALAKLSHPNVVPIYEVGTFEAQIYIAMEFVDGLTLGEWLERGPRAWAETLAVFVQAGRGLAAAHAADIVHRDFKPENVRVGTDGRVRVLDFGLAGSLRDSDSDGHTDGHGDGHRDGQASPPPAPDPSDPSHPSHPSQLSPGPERADDLAGDREPEPEPEPELPVTREGQVMGTPAYMAPEQAAGATVDARSDQFSFCVALYEALYGVRPFFGRPDDPHRFRALGRGRALPGRRPPELPVEIERALVRGLSLDPEQRFATLDALLVELDAAQRPSRRLWLLPAAIVLLGLTAVLAFTLADAPSKVCEDGQARLDGVWDAEVAGRMHEASAAARQPYAVQTWATVERGLDGWARRWRRARQRACEATHVRGDQSPVLYERRIACLDRQLIRVESMLAVLAGLERRPDELVERLTPLLARIPNPDACAAAQLLDVDELEPRAETDADAAASIRAELAASEGLIDAGELEAASARARAALISARALGFEPVHAEAALVLGLALSEQRDDPDGPAEAAAVLEQSAWAAQRSGHTRVLVRAAAALASHLGTQAKLELAGVWAELAAAAFTRLSDEPDIEIELRTNLGRLAATRGDFVAALAEHQRAAELARERGEGHPDHLGALLATGDTLRELGRFDEAADRLDEARRLAAASLGAAHPIVPDLLDVLGSVEASRGRFEPALAHHRASLAILETIHGPSHRSLAKTLNNMAIIFDETGRYTESVATLTRARAILVALLGPEHPDVAFVDVNLGSALQNLERDDEAIERYTAALHTLEASLGGEHMAVGVTLQNLGSARASLGAHEAALADFDRSQAILTAAFDHQHPSVAAVELNRGRSLAALGRFAEARAAEQRALDIRVSVYGPEHPELVEILAGLAELALELGQLDDARTLAERAELLADPSNTASERAEAKLALAKVLVHGPAASEADRARARELGRAGLSLLEAAEAGAEQRRELVTWLRAQGEPIAAPPVSN